MTQVLCRLVAQGLLSVDRAGDARADYADLAVVRYPHVQFLDRIWELRANLTAHDAAFVALSETLGVPLVTTGARLTAAPDAPRRLRRRAGRATGDRARTPRRESFG